ncbi:putative RNA-dependent RNA polymerase [Culex rhabdo-like virus Los Angeles]|uniref:Replicase n=1 Tax=Culex rhabdo-like virus Los Angeles TaxID=2849718 RepID=A0A346M1Z7_9RHAB|nr:putative RNA-dependent RNA polymerase [Culex rhabdo-like virus]AXQ04772.1 putative RNA-dependent RNA polymerase [Culex rhabdo-like virus Los Angeles]AXQ04840.1 RNA-dependent RNA polymerase [Culex mosquito virus 2]
MMRSNLRYDPEREDLDRMEDQVYDDMFQDWSSEMWADSDGYIGQGADIDTSPRYLNNQDYTLNSPLICDELNAFKDFLTKGIKSPLFQNRSWDSRIKWMKKINVDWSNTKATALYHQECARLWTSPGSGTEEFKKMIREVDVEAKETHNVVEAFLSGWIGRKFSHKSRLLNSEATLKFGSFMWESLKISWILNAGTEYELNHLQKSVKFTYLDKKLYPGAVEYKSQLFGTVFIGDGLMYLSKLNMIWDRSMLLMFKDTSTARFHTLFAIQHRYIDEYHINHLKTVEKMYTLGDQVLMHDSISAYEAFGMVEPLSSLKLSELAALHRPLIPSFPHFREHVEGKIAELSRVNPHVPAFFDHLQSVSDKRMLLTIYGSFRHWGHPFIEYLTGLQSLYQNVTSQKEKINKEYAELLASDLAFKILKKEFWNKYRWFVDIDKMDPENPLYEHVKNNTWPSADILVNYPPKWHLLPLIPCWEIPEVVDPAIIYSDKTHSIQKSELIRHLQNYPNTKIPTRKVLETLIKTEATNWPEFLKEIDEHGLNEDDLIIGLKAKEREIKWKGRFFALMSWRLREYFVFTEYLIKKNVIPLFKGLTMADDQTTLVKKMLENTLGQGGNDYSSITVANHIDYEKWNNFQRFESTAPVFRVLGKFFGLENLFVRTHEFFEKSLIYYRDRPDLMKVENGVVLNKNDETRVCWNGQFGGLEGLRQKGWSVLNLLVIERESRIRNTEIKVLAQGDNQVICSQYSINPSKSQQVLRENITSAMKNNDVIIEAIRTATAKIGLRINEDETLQAADMLIYGKTIVYRGNITCLEEKRYSRITCTTNDQLPSLGNVLATVSTNCLTISHYSKSPINAIMSYNWLGNFVLHILSIHNPALRAAPRDLVKDPKALSGKHFRIAALYLDPSLGGISGMSLTRFHLRMFPDPVTEGLTFWKLIFKQTSEIPLKMLAVQFGNPKLVQFTAKNFEKLIEDPTSLNLPRGLSAQNLIKEEIKKALLKNPHLIAHDVIRDAVTYFKDQEHAFLNYLASITPCFPRFVSEFRAGTYFGLTAAIMGLFENSKTIRNLFKKKFKNCVDQAIIRCELGSLECLISRILQKGGRVWDCSAGHADELRQRSWGRKIIGTTVPHPSEMISRVTTGSSGCSGCDEAAPKSIHLIVLVPQGLVSPDDIRGPFHPYLGSSTGETTSLIQSWEKDTDISFLRKASRMRRAFHWFVDPNSNLGRTINGNLKSMTGEDPGQTIVGFKRTGSPLHRYGCSRVSSGGYIANSPVYGSRMIISTDNFQLLGDQNFDFMYQSLMLYAQQTVGELHAESEHSETYHFHIGCVKCLREIEEPTLDSPYPFEFQDVSMRLSKWKCAATPWMNETQTVAIPQGDWSVVNHADQSYQIGTLHGSIYGNLGQSYAETNLLNGLFPIALRSKLYGPSYLLGIRDGLYRAASLEAIHRRIFYRTSTPEDVIRACYISLVDKIAMNSDFLTFTQGEGILKTLRTYSHRVPPSYPLNNTDLGVMVRSFLMAFTYQQWRASCYTTAVQLWIFADFMSIQLSGILIIGFELAKLLKTKVDSLFRDKCRSLSDLLSSVRDGNMSENIQDLINIGNDIKLCDQEVRHAVKFSSKTRLVPNIRQRPIEFKNQVLVPITEYVVEYTSQREEVEKLEVPRIQNPLISGIRIPQIATGSFLKLESILNHLKLDVLDALVGGDGSGGIGSLVLRKYITCRLIFNSLMNMNSVNLGGSLPSPPSAIDYMPDDIRDRCVNLRTAWSNPMDLSQATTWISFKNMKKRNRMNINLAIFDMEVQSDAMSNEIEKRMVEHLPHIMERNCTVIVKSYVSRLMSENSILVSLGRLFHNVMMVQSQLSSSHTSEFYVIFNHLRLNEIIRLYPRWSMVQAQLKNAFCFKSYRQEFDRARQMLEVDLVNGIPALFLPHPVQELLGIWNDISHDRILTSKWSDLSYDSQGSMRDYALATVALLGNQVLNSTTWMGETRLMIPNDQELSKYFAYYIGTYCYIALISNSPKLGQVCQYMIDEPFLIYFYKSDKSKRSPSGVRYHSLSWSVSEKRGWTTKKKVYVQHKMALIGSVIRYLCHRSKTPGVDRQRLWDGKLEDMNKKLTRQHLLNETGSYDLMNFM